MKRHAGNLENAKPIEMYRAKEEALRDSPTRIPKTMIAVKQATEMGGRAMERTRRGSNGGMDRSVFLFATPQSMNGLSDNRRVHPKSKGIVQAHAVRYIQGLFPGKGQRLFSTIEVIGHLRVKKIRWLTGDVSRVFLAGCS